MRRKSDSRVRRDRQTDKRERLPDQDNTLRLAVQRRRKQPPTQKNRAEETPSAVEQLQTRNGGSSAAQRPDTKKP